MSFKSNEYEKSFSRVVIVDPRKKRIKTITKNYTQTIDFDYELNELIENGWTIEEVKTITAANMIILYARLYKYEQAEENNENETKQNED